MQSNSLISAISQMEKSPVTILSTNDLRAKISDLDVARVLDAARGRTILVVGDVMLDEWIIGAAHRISPEAPVPILKWTQRRTAPGGAANVAMNLLKLGARVRLFGVIGDDESGRDLTRELQNSGIDIEGLVRDATRPTTLKTRIVAQRQQVVRIDRESDAPISVAIKNELNARLQNALGENSSGETAVLCLSDYDKGVAGCGLFADVISYAQQLASQSASQRNAQSASQSASSTRALRITVGAKPRNIGCFTHADFLSLNQKEAGEANESQLDSIESIEAAGEKLRSQINVAALAITRGSRGVALFQDGEKPRHLTAHEVEVFDVAGAGDTFLAAATIALAGGADFGLASEIGNLAAAASVRHSGVVAVSPDEVLRIAGEG